VNLQRTPLYESHRALGARLVDFGGWEMPLHYGSQIAEHQAVRMRAGMFDVSHMLAVDVSGPGARDYLRYLLANNVDRLQDVGKALYSCMLAESGGVVDDLILYRLGAGRYRAVVNAATAEKDLEWLARHAVPGVSVEARRDLAMIAVQGPQARDCVWQALPQSRPASEGLAPFSAAETDGLLVARTGYTGEDGFELMVAAARAVPIWDALLHAGVVPAGLGARDTLRLEAGLNLYGEDMDESVTPPECGLGWTVDLQSPRDFIGKRSLVGAAPRYCMLGIVLLERGVLRAHQAVETSRGEGVVTSGSFSPTLQVSIALARLPRQTGPDEEVKVNVRGKWAPARTVKLPFVRRGRSLLPGLPAAPP
jgi:aminomethyltransferase